MLELVFHGYQRFLVFKAKDTLAIFKLQETGGVIEHRYRFSVYHHDNRLMYTEFMVYDHAQFRRDFTPFTRVYSTPNREEITNETGILEMVGNLDHTKYFEAFNRNPLATRMTPIEQEDMIPAMLLDEITQSLTYFKLEREGTPVVNEDALSVYLGLSKKE